MPWIEKKHFYKDFVEQIVYEVQNKPHKNIVWFGVHSRIALIRDYLAALGIDIRYVVDNDSCKHGMTLKREWCMPLRKSYVQINDEDIDYIVAGKHLRKLEVISLTKLSERISDLSQTLFFTATEHYAEIRKQLLDFGASEEKIIGLPSERILWEETCNYFDSIFPEKKIKDLDSHKFTIINILKEFDSFCKRNGLKYYLAYGTLIGAVRHGGIIPWDDDIDIMMPIEDYQRLLQIYPSGGQYEIMDYVTNNDYFFPFAKLTDNYSKLHHVGCPITWYQGEYIDIFPVSGYPEGVDIELWWNKVYLMDIEWYWYYIARDIVPNLKDPRERIQKERFKYTVAQSKNIGVMMTLPPKPWMFSSDLFLNSSELAFEGGAYPVPEEYDRHLRIIYGDYMQLPPIEEREEAHGFPAYY